MKDRPSRQPGIVLENREVVGLVVGSLVVLGVVFYLGVSVGKGLAQQPAEPNRPLEDLDRQAEESLKVELTFAEKLTETPPAKAPEARPAAAPPKEPKAEVPAPARQPAPEPEAEPEPAVAKPAEVAAVTPPPAPEPRPNPPAPPAEANAAPRFTVQLASFPSRAEAEAFAERLRASGLSARIVAAEIPEKGTYYRVRVGSFPGRDEANRYLDDWRREGRFDGIVMPADE